MARKTYTTEEARIRDGRFAVLKSNMDFLARTYPRQEVLYPLMERVIYQDFETLIVGAIEDAEAGEPIR